MNPETTIQILHTGGCEKPTFWAVADERCADMIGEAVIAAMKDGHEIRYVKPGEAEATGFCRCSWPVSEPAQ